METNIKAKIDTINLNIKVDEDLAIIHEKNQYDMIQLYPRLVEIFNTLKIPLEKFQMRDRKVSSKVLINYNGIFIEFKSVPPRPNFAIDHTKKNCHIQLKGEYFLETEYNKFIEVFKKLNPDSVSKIEIAFDFIQEKSFLKDTMCIFLNHRDKVKKFSGENKIYFNLNHDAEENLNYSSSSKIFKLYNKSIELKNNKKKELFYKKNSEFLNKNHYRLELSLMKSSIIDKNLRLTELINNENTETEIIYKFVEYYLKDFYIEKSSEIKKILKKVWKKQYVVER
jgi:hypothetical protein